MDSDGHRVVFLEGVLLAPAGRRAGEVESRTRARRRAAMGEHGFEYTVPGLAPGSGARRRARLRSGKKPIFGD